MPNLGGKNMRALLGVIAIVLVAGGVIQENGMALGAGVVLGVGLGISYLRSSQQTGG